MNYIELLTKEEKSTLCEIITGKEFKEYFKRNEKEFSKIQKGFRAKTLTEQHALSIALTHIDKPFISLWVNKRVEHWLEEIKENIAKLEEEGSSHGAALATTMLNSPFVNNIELYFKLTETPLTTNSCSDLYERMEDIKSEHARIDEISNQIKAIEEENQRLTKQIEEAERNIDAIKNECAEEVRKINQDKVELAAQLAEAQARISELQTAPSAIKCDDAEYLAQLDDTNLSALPSANTNEIFSLCCVTTDPSNKKYLMRYADLNSSGRYSIFHKNEDSPPFFTNREKIYYKNGPSDDNFYGVWRWSADSNKNDPTKDFIQSWYKAEIDAIEIINIVQASNLDSLARILKKGIAFQPHSHKVMFSFHVFKGRYIGLLCSSDELETVAGKTTISKDRLSLPVYEFAGTDIMRLDNTLSFYRNAFAGIPSKLYYLKSPLEIVKDIVLSSISWTAYKARELTRAQYNTFKDFLDLIPVDDITCKIGTSCRCSIPAAKELLNEFLSIVWKYLDGESLDDQIVRSAISVNTELQEKAKELVRQDWEKENENLLTEAKKELNLLREELKTSAEELDEAQEALEKTKAADEQLSCSIAEKEKLAEDVEIAVAEKIRKARENVSDFIASMTFIGGQPVHFTETTIPASINATPGADIDIYCTYPESEDICDLEAHHSWEDVINTTIYELSEAGVAEQCRNGLAAFLCAAYIEKQPLLLVGPNAIDIAQAFCAAITANKHGTLYCEGVHTYQTIKKIGADGENIVIINNLLASGWMNRLPEILAQKDIFYIATHPYTEDIQVEPKSLYGFMLPLFTELLVDKKATGKYYGGYFADDFKSYSAVKGARKELTVLAKFALSSLVRSKINSLAATMHNIYSSATTDDDFLFFIFPIAYASMAINELSEVVADPQNGIAISADLKRGLRYVLGEN